MELAYGWHGEEVSWASLYLGIVCGAVGLLWVIFATKDTDAHTPQHHHHDHADLLRSSKHARLLLPPDLASQLDLGEKTSMQRIQTYFSRKPKKATGPKSPKGAEPEHRGAAAPSAPIPVPPGAHPLLVFINGKSGGQQGTLLLQRFRRLLHPSQVVELPKSKPGPALRQFGRLARFWVLVCGGDGTVGWVLSEMEAQGIDAPLAIMPLGTGNDLARVLGWGGGWEGGSVADILQHVSGGHVEPLDRWGLRNKGKGAPPPLQHWTNYVSVGADAEVALRFHRHRNRSPKAFFSRIMNKVWYARHGIATYLSQLRRAAAATSPTEGACLPGKLRLFCDDVEVELPEDTKGVIVTNIGSYGGGATSLWPGPAPVDKSDRSVEVVAVSGVFHLTQVQLGLACGVPLGKCKRVRIVTQQRLAMQVDGEPWEQDPSELEIGFHASCQMVCRTADSAGATVAEMTEVLDWAEAKGHITADQVATLLTELHSRIGARRGSITE